GRELLWICLVGEIRDRDLRLLKRELEETLHLLLILGQFLPTGDQPRERTGVAVHLSQFVVRRRQTDEQVLHLCDVHCGRNGVERLRHRPRSATSTIERRATSSVSPAQGTVFTRSRARGGQPEHSDCGPISASTARRRTPRRNQGVQNECSSRKALAQRAPNPAKTPDLRADGVSPGIAAHSPRAYPTLAHRHGLRSSPIAPSRGTNSRRLGLRRTTFSSRNAREPQCTKKYTGLAVLQLAPTYWLQPLAVPRAAPTMLSTRTLSLDQSLQVSLARPFAVVPVQGRAPTSRV